jgi:beta-1,4-mannosyltransferase
VNPPTVVFQITAIGRNPSALETSARSVLYWVRRTRGLCFRAVLWIVIEPEGYVSAPSRYERLRDSGADILIVPREYSTPLGTHGKARALEYACEARRVSGLAGPSVWIYHQDEETCVGEDTLRGIDEFVREGRYLIGAGVILYPLDWSASPSHVQELTRTYDDLRVLDSMTMPYNPTTGFHGSHVLVRADVEDTVGWDNIGYSPAEDLSFEIRVRAWYGPVFGVLRGFAYEKGAFALRDQLRQRRRWVHGILFAMIHSTELPRTRRLAVFYCALSWFAALPSVGVMLASFLFHYGEILLVTGVFTGFVWVSMVTGYLLGYRMHTEYLDRTVSLPRLIGNGLVGALVDVLAPWYALLTRPSLGDFVAKDRAIRSVHPAWRDRPSANLPGRASLTISHRVEHGRETTPIGSS